MAYYSRTDPGTTKHLDGRANRSASMLRTWRRDGATHLADAKPGHRTQQKGRDNRTPSGAGAASAQGPGHRTPMTAPAEGPTFLLRTCQLQGRGPKLLTCQHRLRPTLLPLHTSDMLLIM